MKKLSTIIASLALSACTSLTVFDETIGNAPVTVGISLPTHERLVSLPEINGPVITISVYNFLDKTGQRKPSDKFSQLSSAVGQGAEVWVIQALKDAGDGAWFKVVERVGLDNLVKERQLIRSTRESYEDKDVRLKPLLFAGLIIEGGVVAYDSNVMSGGNGARYFGIGASEKYRVDQVTVAMRVVSVQTGEVLLTVSGTKTIASMREGVDVFRFIDMGTRAVEMESGVAQNEPVNYAVRSAIEHCVIEIINRGQNSGLWKFKEKENEKISQ